MKWYQKFWIWLKAVTSHLVKFIADLLTNDKGWADVNKILGILFALTGLLAVIRPSNPIPFGTFVAIETAASAFLGISLVGNAQVAKSSEPPRY